MGCPILAGPVGWQAGSTKTSRYAGLKLVWLERGILPRVLAQGWGFAVGCSRVALQHFGLHVQSAAERIFVSSSVSVRGLLRWHGLLPHQQAWGC